MLCVCVFQPGCVNTTEADIKKSSRMKQPHKTRKVTDTQSHHVLLVIVSSGSDQEDFEL